MIAIRSGMSMVLIETVFETRPLVVVAAAVRPGMFRQHRKACVCFRIRVTIERQSVTQRMDGGIGHLPEIISVIGTMATEVDICPRVVVVVVVAVIIVTETVNVTAIGTGIGTVTVTETGSGIETAIERGTEIGEIVLTKISEDILLDRDPGMGMECHRQGTIQPETVRIGIQRVVLVEEEDILRLRHVHPVYHPSSFYLVVAWPVVALGPLVQSAVARHLQRITWTTEGPISIVDHHRQRTINFKLNSKELKSM